MPGLDLTRGRLHEACGPARRSFAMWIAAQVTGPVLWIAPAWGVDRLMPDGMAQWTDPARFLFADPTRPDDILWCMEEALRSGVIPLVVADLPEPPALTPVRRLHLAAEASATAPLGLILTPGDGGAPGVESRWHCAPDHRLAAPGWQVTRSRARTTPPQTWRIAPASGAAGLVAMAPRSAND